MYEFFSNNDFLCLLNSVQAITSLFVKFAVTVELMFGLMISFQADTVQPVADLA